MDLLKSDLLLSVLLSCEATDAFLTAGLGC